MDGLSYLPAISPTLLPTDTEPVNVTAFIDLFLIISPTWLPDIFKFKNG